MNTKFLFLAAITALLNIYSCKKETSQLETPPIAGAPTKFRFYLYTSSDFSEYNSMINFKMNIRNNQDLIVDSSLVTMRVKDIPNEANKLVFERTVWSNQPGTLKAGFVYTLENVGISWYFDTCPVGTAEKIVDFNFK